MNLLIKIEDAKNYSESLHKAISEVELTNKSTSSVMALRLFAIAHNHYEAIVLLMQNDLPSSSAALLRPLLESHIRGLWIWQCAKEIEINEIIENDEKFSSLSNLVAIVKNNTNLADFFPLADEYQKDIKALNDLTHTGIVHINKWNRSDVIEAKFSKDELDIILKF